MRGPKDHVDRSILRAEPPLKGIRVPCKGFEVLFGAAISQVQSYRDRINALTIQSGAKAQNKRIPETMACRILLFVWSFEAPA